MATQYCWLEWRRRGLDYRILMMSDLNMPAYWRRNRRGSAACPHLKMASMATVASLKIRWHRATKNLVVKRASPRPHASDGIEAREMRSAIWRGDSMLSRHGISQRERLPAIGHEVGATDTNAERQVIIAASPTSVIPSTILSGHYTQGGAAYHC